MARLSCLDQELVEKILGNFSVSHLPDSIILKNIIAFHREFLDGSGYPAGLSEGEIPKEARIITASDINDALTSIRLYKKAWHADEVLKELTSMVSQGKLDQVFRQSARNFLN